MVASAAGGVHGLLGPLSVTFLLHMLVVIALPIGALGLLSNKNANVKGMGASAGQPPLHVYVPSTVIAVVGNPEVGFTLTPAKSATASWAKKPIAKQATASAGISRRIKPLPFASRTFGANCAARRTRFLRLSTHNGLFMH